MKITGIETLRLDEFANLLWVRVHTDEGISGVGETFFGARTVEAYVHEMAAPKLLGRDPSGIERIAADLVPYVGYQGTGAETRGRSAIDVALWDLAGKAAGRPVYELLGGLSRDRVRTYNTCAGYGYVRTRVDYSLDAWGRDDAPEGPYEDLDAFLHRGDELAESLLEQGITGMKIWPFDEAAFASDGYRILPAELAAALEPFERIRAAVGDRMDIMVELHGLWRMPAALRIAEALEDLDPFWYEDPVRPDSIDAWCDFKAATRVPVCGSETLCERGMASLIERGGADIVMPDIVWCGGFTAARRIAALAHARHRPIAPHDCTGPLAFAAAVHLSLSAPNVLVQESVRAFHSGWYRELATGIPEIRDGHIHPPEGPGLGTELLPDIGRRKDATVVVSGKSSDAPGRS